MGEVYAYLIDFVTEYGEVSYRVFYQDTAGLFKYEPTCETHTESECQRHCDSILVRGDTSIECELRRRKVDVAILTLAGAHNLDGKYLGKLVARLQADLYIVGHWEDFFDNFNESPKVVRGSDADLFINRLESSLRPGDQWVLPYPSKTITVGHGSNF